MKVYKVGGCIRDALLGLQPTDSDWVVCGATIEEMIQKGFKPVGVSFPVFLHPKTKEEYALARTEKKVKKGYQGFVFNTDPSVTLEQDLSRRDLTINAIAQDEAGHLIDPYGGQSDIQNRKFRHVSDAFVEDPVRVLRVARFYSRFKAHRFTIDDKTIALMKEMVRNGEVQALQNERVWQETYKALGETHPEAFFEVLEKIGALSVIFPGFKDNIDWKMIEETLRDKKLSRASVWTLILFLAGFSEESGRQLNKKLSVPKLFLEASTLFLKHYVSIENALASAQGIVDLLQSLDCFRRPERLDQFAQAVAVMKPEMAADLINAYQLAQAIDARLAIQENPSLSPQIAVEQARVKALISKE